MSNADEDVKKGLAEAVGLWGCHTSKEADCRSGQASITLSAEQLRKREGELLYEVHLDVFELALCFGESSQEPSASSFCNKQAQ